MTTPFTPGPDGSVDTTTAFKASTAGAGAAGAYTYNLDLDTYIKLQDVAHSAIKLDGAGVWTVNINGGVTSQFWDSTLNSGAGGLTGNALALENYTSTANSKVIVGTEGTIAGYRHGIYSDTAADITNSGLIEGYRSALSFDGSDGTNFLANGMGDHSNLTGAKTLTVTNNATGVIFSDFTGVNNFSQATLKLTNAGQITGGVTHAWDATYMGAAIASDFINPESGAVPGGGGTLVFSNSATGIVDGNIQMGWINSSVNNVGIINGTIRAYLPHDGNGVIDLNLNGIFDTTAGDSTVSTYTGTVDTITNTGTINGVSDYGQDQIDPSKYFQVAMDLSNGIDVVNNSGTIYGDIWLRGGNDKFTNSGTVHGWLDAGSGNNTLTNSGTINGISAANDIVATSDNNTITNSGHVLGGIFLYGGNDKLDNSKGTIDGWIHMGTGVNTVTGGAGVDKVVYEGGADTFHLGAGNDILIVNDAPLSSLFDGGTGINVLNLSSAVASANLNLTAGTLSFSDHPSTNDSVLSFQNIYGSAFGDTLKGSAAAESIHGGIGSDIITGGGGADQLWGGAGADTFVFNAITDSLVARAGRDTIHDFVQGTDIVSLQFDANTLVANNQAFTSIITDTAFTHTPGQLREVHVGAQTIVQGDVNGDGKADFAIAFDGTFNFTLSDFHFIV